MKAIRVHEVGDVSKLIYEEVPVPEPKPGEVRVKVKAIGLNFADIYQRVGWYPVQTPFSPGTEFAGMVDKLGEGVTEFKIGERVGTASGRDAYAEYAVAQAVRLAKLADELTFEQAAALLEQGLTAHYLATSTYPLKPGDTALVHAGAGGVGQLLVQIAKSRGARVITTVSTEAKASLARQCGADEVILYSQQDFVTEVKRLTGGLGVDVVYDSVGKDTFEKSLNCLKPRGLMVLYGQSSGPVLPQDPQILNRKGSLYLTRPTLGAYLQTREEFLGRANDLFQWVAGGTLKLRVDQTFPLERAAAAQGYMEERKTLGKVLILPN
jgi:NADPH:quinone reductase